MNFQLNGLQNSSNKTPFLTSIKKRPRNSYKQHKKCTFAGLQDFFFISSVTKSYFIMQLWDGKSQFLLVCSSEQNY